MSESWQNPQNPYGSYIVAASAGCGKTYQLSRRFLFLVSAGADPASILTVTFTRKAAAEMRERILLDATRLLYDPKAQSEFSEAISAFYSLAVNEPHPLQSPNHRLPPPCTPEQTALKILSSTQALRISTIDSIFMEWLRKFPWEASDPEQGVDGIFPANFTILSQRDQEILDRKVWAKTCQEIIYPLEQGSKHDKLLDSLSLMEVKNRLDPLQKNKTFLWVTRRLREEQGLGKSALNPHVLPSSSLDDLPLDERSLVNRLAATLLKIVDATQSKKKQEMIAGIAAGDLARLIELRLFTKDLAINGNTVRAKLQEQLSTELQQVSSLCGSYINDKRLRQLNDEGEFLYALYQAYDRHWHQAKCHEKVVEFDDMAKGSYQLFANSEAAGARFLIHKRVSHILLDEFQDTSLLQWSIFHSMSIEMLSGLGMEKEGIDICPSVFIVGDEKQSIYGFREADARILADAGRRLKRFGVFEVPLNHSYRTSQIILDFVNAHFQHEIDDFPRHQTAQAAAGEAVVPDLGSIVIGELFAASGEDDKLSTAAIKEKEASFVADYLAAALTDAEPLWVYDKKSKSYRRLKAGDCAILYRAATHAPYFEAALRSRGIEVRREDGGGFFARIEVQDFVALLKYLAWPTDLLSLITVLKSPIGEVSDQLLMGLLHKSLDQHATPIERGDWILNELGPSYSALRDLITRMSSMVHQGSLFRLLAHAILTWQISERYRLAFPGAEGELASANIMQFLDLGLELENSGFKTLPALLQRCEELKSNEEFANAAAGENAVTLLTIHKSKGLEYPLVALVGTGEAWEKRDPHWAKGSHCDFGDGLYYMSTASSGNRPQKDAAFDQIYSEIDSGAEAENLRLLYVAITRTQHHLLITGSRGTRAVKEEGFHKRLWDTAENLGFIRENRHEKLVLTCERRDPGYPAAKADTSSEISLEVSSIIPLSELETMPAPATEIYTLTPHRLLNPADDIPHAGSAGRGSYARQVGLWIHRGLECAVSDKEFDGADYWQSLLHSDDNELAQLALSEASKELSEALAADALRSLLREYPIQKPELPVVHLHQNDLVRGTIDLYLENAAGEIVLLDFKTLVIGDAFTDLSALRHLCKSKGYDKQLALYVAAIKQVKQHERVRGAVYFTNINRSLFIS